MCQESHENTKSNVKNRMVFSILVACLSLDAGLAGIRLVLGLRACDGNLLLPLVKKGITISEER